MADADSALLSDSQDDNQPEAEENSNDACAVESVSDPNVAYEVALETVGHGTFQILLLAACGWTNAGNALMITYISFALPRICDLPFTSAEKGWVTGIVFAGLLVGDLFWGSLADLVGRKPTTMVSLAIGVSFGFLSALAPNVSSFLAFRFLVGVGIGGSITILFPYYCEFLTKERRAPWVSGLSCFWLIGSLLAAGMAWVMIPQDEFSIGGRTVSSWRVYVAVCSIVSFGALIPLWFMPESPKFLYQKGKIDKAQKILAGVQKINFVGFGCLMRQRRGYFPVQVVHIQHKEYTTESNAMQIPLSKCDGCDILGRQFVAGLKEMGGQMRDLLLKPWRQRTNAMLVVTFSFAFGYYGFTIWLPDYFDHIQADSNCSFTCGGTNNCSQLLIQNIYFEAFVPRIATIPGQVITIIIVNRVTAKLLMVISTVLSSGSVFAFALFTRKVYGPILMSSIFGAVSVAGWTAMDILFVELFPTNLRSTAVGLLQASARLGAIVGNLIFGQMINVHFVAPLFLSAILMLLGSLTALVLPRTAKEVLQ